MVTVLRGLAAPVAAEESDEYQPEDIHGSEEGGYQAEDVHPFFVVPGGGQYLVLAPEAREGGYPRYRQPAYGKGGECPGHRLCQPPHAPDVVCARGVVDAARAQEEERLEEGVGEQVEHCRGHSPDTQGKHHEPQLTDGGIGQHALDVGHHQAHGGCKQGGAGPDVGDGVHRRSGGLEDGEHAGHQEHPRCDHGGGVN